MSFHDELKKKIPQRLHIDPNFGALQDFVRMNGFSNKDELNTYFEKEIKVVEEWLNSNQNAGGTAVKDIRDKIVKLESLKNCKSMCDDFL